MTDTLLAAAERVVAAWHTRNRRRVTDAGWTPAEGALDDAIGALGAAVGAERERIRNVGMPTQPIDLPLLGEDGNSFAIIGRLRTALKRAGASHEYIEMTTADAMSGDYDHVLQVAMREIEASGGTIR